jgi:hypothetical protein
MTLASMTIGGMTKGGMTGARQPFDGLLHRPPGAGLVIELEPAQPHRALVQRLSTPRCAS